MAITLSEVHILWSGSADTDVVGAGSSEQSLEYNPDATCVAASITLKAEYTSGAPASDDTIYFRLLRTNGDPDDSTAGTDEFDTALASSIPGGGRILAVLNLSTGETSGSGKKVVQTVTLPLPFKGAKIQAEGITAGSTNGITVSAVVTEQRAA